MSAVVARGVRGDDAIEEDGGSNDADEADKEEEERMLVDRGRAWSSTPRLVMLVLCAVGVLLVLGVVSGSSEAGGILS